MRNDRAAQTVVGSDVELYPHLKVTGEKYPRILATRRIEDDGAEYFGAFLTKTSVRLLIDFLNRTFRLRSCDISIDGTFPVPCTQFYRRRCLAPCVESLCDRESYLHMVKLARLFLANKRSSLIEELNTCIESAAGVLDFEAATSFRDILRAVEEYWQNSRYQVWLDDAVDTYAAETTEDNVFVHLVTQRGRRVLGRKVFSFPLGIEAGEAIEKVIANFYRFHIPKEIRVYQNIEDRRKLASALSDKFGRTVHINIVREAHRRLSTSLALYQSRDERELDVVKPRASAWEIERELQDMFGLEAAPGRIEAFDVAHISGSGLVGASSVWIDGHFIGSEYRFQLSAGTSELAALKESVALRLSEDGRPKPDLILVDGGKAQLGVVTKVAETLSANDVAIASVVKPQRKHSEVSHFLDQVGNRIDFDESSPAHRVLRLLRDDAHELANRVHSELRDMSHFYELASILPSIDESQRRRLLSSLGSVRKIVDSEGPTFSKMFGERIAENIVRDLSDFRSGKQIPISTLIVPLRFDAENGDAADLRPIVG